jgi:DNA polymerase-3 subunit delta'
MWQVVGHEKAIALFTNSLRGDKLSHAYLFVGPHHVGKMTLALNLAQALNCTGDEKPCGECAPCRRIAEHKHADIQIIGVINRAEISIDQIRDMEHSATMKPFEGQNRVFIIDGAENLSSEAANCLLKTLEEPPPYVCIILLALNERFILPTVRSRCQKVELMPLPISQVEEAFTERWKVPPERARLLARLSAGCPGWALGALHDERILDDRAKRLSTLSQLAKQDRVERFAYAISLANQFSKNRETARETLQIWMSWWRDLLLISGECKNSITNVDLEDELFHEASYYCLPGIKAFIDYLFQAIEALDRNANPRLVLETLMLKIPTRKGGLNPQLCQN